MHISQPFRFSQDISEDLSFYTEAFSVFRMPVHGSMKAVIKNISVANHLTAAGEVVSTPVSLAIIRTDELESMIQAWDALGLTIEAGAGDVFSPLLPGFLPPDSPVMIGEPSMIVVREALSESYPIASALGLIRPKTFVTTVSAQSSITMSSEIMDTTAGEFLYLIPYLDGLKTQPIVSAGRIVFDLLYLGDDGSIFYGDGGR